MFFLLPKLGIANGRQAFPKSYANVFQVTNLSFRSAFSLNGKWPLFQRNCLALWSNCDRLLAFSTPKPRHCHVASQAALDPLDTKEVAFPQPVQGIKNLSKLMEDKLDMNPIFSFSSTYEPSSNINKIELTLNWPEKQTFVASAREKKVAQHLTCSEALQWLYINKHINKSMRPIMSHETSSLNTLQVDLSQPIANEVDEVLQFYSKEVVPALSNFDRTWKHYDLDMLHIHPTLGIPYPSSEDLEEWNKTLKPPRHRRTIKLPIDEYRNEILQSIKNNRITLVKGETGCGKTTKVPQFILDEALAEGRGAHCNIAVCLPRRITAKETAKFVASSRGERLGQSVGYNVRMERVFPSVLGGSISFMTGQKLALKFTGNNTLRGVSHIILDEVHLRDIGTDLVMFLLKRALEVNTDLRVIIMSATIESDIFQSYFSCFGTMPIVEVPGRMFPVKMHFLHDLPAALIPANNRLNDNQVGIDYDLVKRVVLWLHQTKPEGGILVFVSGWGDIIELSNLLNDEELLVIPVHRRLKDNSEAWRPARKGLRKVILATNVAETSITFPDIVYVVDCGIHKVSQRKQSSRGRWSYEDLTSTWISKANAIQRRGRAGRVRPGESYHLFTEETYEQMADHESPQICNSVLESVVMMTKIINPKIEAETLLGEFPQPPSSKDISETVTTLKELSFLSHTDETPTALGAAAMKMSAPLPAARAMILSAIYRCVDTTVSVLACEEETPLQLVEATAERNIKTSYHTSSDHLAKAKAISSHSPASTRTKRLKYFYKCMVEGQSDLLQNADLNEHDSEMLVKSTLLHSYGSLLMRFKTPFNQFMIDNSSIAAVITNRSVNCKFDKMAFPFAMYLSSQGKERIIFVPDTSTVSPLSVLLFLPTDFRTEELDSENIAVKGWRNNYISLVLSKIDYYRVQELRRCLKDIQDYFIITEILNYPDENYDLMCGFRKDVLNCLNNMFSTELAHETDL